MFIKMEIKEKHNRSALMRVQPNNSNSVTIAALVKTPIFAIRIIETLRVKSCVKEL